MRATTRPILLVLVLALSAYPTKAQYGDLHIRDRIFIDGDAELRDSNAVVGGSGTESDPFRIEGWRIIPTPHVDRTGPIVIRNTTLHVIITSNIVWNPYGTCGILLQNVHNITVNGNEVSTLGDGVCVHNSSNSSIDANFISYLTPSAPSAPIGILALRSHNLTIQTNHVKSFGLGVAVQIGCRDIVIRGNLVEEIGIWGGIEATGDCERIRIVDNRVHDVAGAGIQSYVSRNVTITGNHLSDVGSGFVVDDFPGEPNADNVTIANNSLLRFDNAIWLRGIDLRFEHNTMQDGNWIGGQLNLGGRSTFRWNDVHAVAGGWRIIGVPLDATANNFHDPIERIFDGYTPVDARDSWWGSPDGPAPGTIVGGALYEPWASMPVPGAGVVQPLE